MNEIYVSYFGIRKHFISDISLFIELNCNSKITSKLYLTKIFINGYPYFDASKKYRYLSIHMALLKFDISFNCVLFLILLTYITFKLTNSFTLLMFHIVILCHFLPSFSKNKIVSKIINLLIYFDKIIT